MATKDWIEAICCQVNFATRLGLLKVILKRIAVLSLESALDLKRSKNKGYKAIYTYAWEAIGEAIGEAVRGL